MSARESHLARWLKVHRVIGWMYRNLPWLRIPVVQFVFSFWVCLMDEGIKSTCKPRWGAVTFGYLNDGMKPTLWHTWRSVTHSQRDPYTGIYVNGAPKSLKQAQEWEKEAQS